MNDSFNTDFLNPLEISFSTFYANFSMIQTPNDYFFTEIQLTNDRNIFSNSLFITAADLSRFSCADLDCVPLVNIYFFEFSFS